MTNRPHEPVAPTRPPVARSAQNNRLLIAFISGTIALGLSLLVIILSVVQTATATTATVRATPTPLPTATATLVPTPTLVPLATPHVGQNSYQVIYGTPVTFEVYLVDPVSGRVLFAQHSTTQQTMASTTKIMTAVVAILFGNLNQVITVPADADATYLSICCQASTMGIHHGERYTLQQLLYGLLLPSGDDAATAIAEGLLGSQTAYVARMNLVANWFGLTHTHYANVSGLDDSHNQHYTTAADLARLTDIALTLPTFRQVVATPTYTIAAANTHGQLLLGNTNMLLQDPDGKRVGIDGVKTGFTGNAGECVVLHANLHGHQLIAVILGDGTPTNRFIDGLALIVWGFKAEGLVVKLSS